MKRSISLGLAMRAGAHRRDIMGMLSSTYTARAPSTVATAPRPNWCLAIAKAVGCALVFAALVCAAQPASAQFTQQGQKLVGTGASAAAEQGVSVALSGDGNTAIVGGPADNSSAGAAWVFSQNGGVWTQAGPKLLGNGAGGTTVEGRSVALSANGDTAIVGGPENNSNAGAAWVFSLGVNLGLFGSGAAGPAEQGYSVALSANGNTAILGGPGDNSDAGAVWVFTKSGGVWTPQGPKLFGGGAVGAARQGYSVALSADGNTAIVGGYGDNSDAGAAWVFTRSDGGVWTQQGPKLFGNGAVGGADQGASVTLSADGNTAIVGGPGDNANAGAAWVFIRSGGGVWTPQGPKLFGSGAVGAAQQGVSVALSADGNTAIVGGYADDSNAGAVWIFSSPSPIAGSLTAIPKSGPAPLIVTFRAMGLPLPMTYTINFGDGTSGALSQGSCFGSGNGVQCSGSASHSYAAGTYDAALVNASGSTLGAATITAGGNLVRPLQPPPAMRVLRGAGRVLARSRS
jgi:hypothetical protein